MVANFMIVVTINIIKMMMMMMIVIKMYVPILCQGLFIVSHILTHLIVTKTL